MSRPLVVQGERTRLHVVADRLRAGLPFYWYADRAPPLVDSDGLRFLGYPVVVLDMDGQHLVLQLAPEDGETA